MNNIETELPFKEYNKFALLRMALSSLSKTGEIINGFTEILEKNKISVSDGALEALKLLQINNIIVTKYLTKIFSKEIHEGISKQLTDSEFLEVIKMKFPEFKTPEEIQAAMETQLAMEEIAILFKILTSSCKFSIVNNFRTGTTVFKENDEE